MVERSSPTASPLVIFDGHCQLCHGYVRFLLRFDQHELFSFIAADREESLTIFTDHHLSDRPESVALLHNKQLYLRSAALWQMLTLLGGPWRWLAIAGGIVPTPLADAIYDLIAKVRYRIFGRRAESGCPLVPLELRHRFR